MNTTIITTYVPKYFRIQELVDPKTYSLLHDGAVVKLEPMLCLALDTIKEMLHRPMTVNNWTSEGPYHWRGLRTTECKEGAPTSQHRLGNAFDFDVEGMTAEEVRVWLQAHKDAPGLEGIMRMEAKTDWVHIDGAKGHGPRIHIFAP